MIQLDLFYKGERTMPKYGDKTAKKLDNYLSNYTMPKGTTRTGLAAPYYDLKRNFDKMNELELKESDSFFHCKANYEATKRGGLYGAAISTIGGYLKEAKDIFKYPLDDVKKDLRANARGRAGANSGKSLQETCPTHHTKYK